MQFNIFIFVTLSDDNLPDQKPKHVTSIGLLACGHVIWPPGHLVAILLAWIGHPSLRTHFSKEMKDSKMLN